MQRSVQDGSLALEVDGYRTAFLRSISEYNDFAGVARYQISEDSALQLFGFKVGFCFEVIDCHTINYSNDDGKSSTLLVSPPWISGRSCRSHLGAFGETFASIPLGKFRLGCQIYVMLFQSTCSSFN